MSAAFYDFVRGRSDDVPAGYTAAGLRVYRHLVYLGASQMIEEAKTSAKVEGDRLVAGAKAEIEAGELPAADLAFRDDDLVAQALHPGGVGLAGDLPSLAQPTLARQLARGPGRQGAIAVA